jgi:hypothetical protein
MKKIFATILLVSLPLAPLGAFGRKPPPDQDYPDYNRLDLHPKNLPPPSAPAPEQPETPPPFTRPPLNVPVNAQPDIDSAPRPPPKVVPVPDGASEPALPDDMMNTLVPSTTGQK